MTLKEQASNWVRYLCNVHVPGGKPNIFLLSTPRSGSTWLMEAIAADRGVRPCNEPLNLRKPEVVRRLGIDDWRVLQRPAALPQVERYLRAVSQGRIGFSFRTPRPGQRGYQAVSNRVVFKILFGCEDQIDWIRSTFGAQVVCLIRHPIPVSISREVTPRLPALMESAYLQGLPPTSRAAAERIYRDGDPLECAQLDWCLQNGPLIASFDRIDLFITYEQLVLQPDVVTARLIETLDLAQVHRVRASVEQLSASVAKSSQDSLQLLEQRNADSMALLVKWRARVDEVTERRLMAIAGDLGIDIYRAGRLLPDPRYWIGQDYPKDGRFTAEAQAVAR